MAQELSIRRILLYSGSIGAGASQVCMYDAGLGTTQGGPNDYVEKRLLNIAKCRAFSLILDTVTPASGTAVVSATYEVCAGVGNTWVTPQGNTIISNAAAATANFISPPVSQFIRITLNNGGVDRVTVKAYLMVQEEQ